MFKTQLKKHLLSLDNAVIVDFILDMTDFHKDHFEYSLKQNEQ